MNELLKQTIVLAVKFISCDINLIIFSQNQSVNGLGHLRVTMDFYANPGGTTSEGECYDTDWLNYCIVNPLINEIFIVQFELFIKKRYKGTKMLTTLYEHM